MLEMHYPLVEKNSSYWLERQKAGKACTMWFTNFEDLFQHVFDNIPAWERRTESFTLKAVKLINQVQIKDNWKPDEERINMYQGDWYDFKELEHGKWILRGKLYYQP